MRHNKIKKINKSIEHKNSMLKNMLYSIMSKNHIRTTVKNGNLFKSFFVRIILKIFGTKINKNFFPVKLFKNKNFFKNFKIFKKKCSKIVLTCFEDGYRKGDLSKMIFIYFCYKI